MGGSSEEKTSMRSDDRLRVERLVSLPGQSLREDRQG